MGKRRSNALARDFPGGLEWFENDGDLDAQCARCGSSVGRLDGSDPGSELFCLSSPEWCAQNPLKGRSHVRGAHYPIDTEQVSSNETNDEAKER